MIIEPSRPEDFKPLGPKTWVGCKEEHLSGGCLRLRHWIDRGKPPAESVYAVWLLRLSAKQAAAKVRNRTASSWDALPDDHLAGYDWGGWTSPFGFRLGGCEFQGDGAKSPSWR